MLFAIVITFGLSAQALSWTDFILPSANYPIAQPNPYTQYNQAYYPNSYQTQCISPYQYQNPYSYSNNIPYSITNPTVSGTTGGTSRILKNIGQSVLYSMIRGY